MTIVARPPAFASGARPATRKRDAGNLERIAVDLAATLDDEQIKKFVAYRKLNKGVPSEFDGKLLAKARDAIGRDLDKKERSNLRAGFVEAVKKRKPALFPTI